MNLQMNNSCYGHPPLPSVAVKSSDMPLETPQAAELGLPLQLEVVRMCAYMSRFVKVSAYSLSANVSQNAWANPLRSFLSDQ